MSNTAEPQENNEIQLNKKLNKKPNKLCKVVRWVISIVLILAVGYLVLAFNNYVILTNSMEPIINVDSTVVINKYASIDKLEQFDIIAFYADLNDDGIDEVVVHYVYSIEEIDGNTVIRTIRHNINDDQNVFDLTETEKLIELDSWILSEDDYVGKLVTVINNDTFGSLLLFSSSSIGRIVLVIDIVVIYLLIEMFSTSEKKKAKEIKEIENDNSKTNIDTKEE